MRKLDNSSEENCNMYDTTSTDMSVFTNLPIVSAPSNRYDHYFHYGNDHVFVVTRIAAIMESLNQENNVHHTSQGINDVRE